MQENQPIEQLSKKERWELKHQEKEIACPECGISYKEAEWAKKCTVWCKEHKSCNLEIIKHAVSQTNSHGDSEHHH